MYVKNRLPMYEGDGFIHAGSIPGVAVDPLADRTEGTLELLDLEQRARGLRGEVIAGVLRNFVAWVRHKALPSRSDALDEYLARSTSLADIERRLKEIERNGSFLPG